MANFLSSLSNLQQRLIVGVAGATIILSGIWFNHWSYFALFTLICFFSLKEFHAMVNSVGIGTNKTIGVIIGTILYILSFVLIQLPISREASALYLPLLMLFFLVELFQQNPKPFERTAFSILAIVYTALPYAILNHIVFIGGDYNSKIPLGILLLMWANDIGGYFGGKYFGKHKLYERVSPKKTWEGSISGLILGLGVAVVLNQFLELFSLPFWLGLATVIVITGSLGDLIESQFKRSLGIKDSGSSLPGHGGFLDRFDGLIIALPFILVYFLLFARG